MLKFSKIIILGIIQVWRNRIRWGSTKDDDAQGKPKKKQRGTNNRQISKPLRSKGNKHIDFRPNKLHSQNPNGNI